MNKYEMMYVVKPFDEELVADISERVLNVLKKYGAEIKKNDAWGKKALAYEIAGFREGYYYLATFNLKDRVIKKIHDELNFIEDVLRLMIIVKDK